MNSAVDGGIVLKFNQTNVVCVLN